MTTVEKRPCAAVVVLGDVGRSPRMCNHAISLAEKHYHVQLVGYTDTTPHERVSKNPNISIISLPPPPDFLSNFSEVIQLPLKFIWAFFTLFFTLLFRTDLFNLRLVLLQNPPALPTMITCFVVSRIKRAKFVIDWHNYMYSILKDKYQLSEAEIFDRSPIAFYNAHQTEQEDSDERKSAIKRGIVRYVAKWEMVCGRLSDANLCVSEAMKSNLRRLFQIDANVFYDRPPAWKFCEKTLEEIHNVYSALATDEKYKVLSPNGNPDETLITERVNGVVKYRADRPLLLFSSTSWTPDENFGILFDALVEYNALVELSDDRLPRLLVLITGKGPLKEHYLSQISEKQMRFVDVVSPWLAAEDYPTIVASADLGVSLHTSTSGLDLPMKVVDMFGARRPVLAKNFRCISELVKESENGNLFDSSDQLTQLLVDLAEGFPEESRLNKLKKNVLEMKFETWEEMWEKTAAPTLLLDQNQKETKKNN